MKVYETSVRYRITAVAVVALAIVAVVVIALVGKPSNPSAIPDNIVEEAAFTIFYPRSHVRGLSARLSSVSYSRAGNTLSYVVYVDGKQVFVSEQATPDVFSQNGVYAYKLSQAHEYNSFNSSAGEISLTRPTGLSNQTVAWDNAKNTLVLAHALGPLTNTDWQRLFNNMLVIN